MVLTVHNLRIVRVTRNEFDTFSVKLKYSAEWTSRYATHPCQINLYSDGKGVGPRGKFIPAADWWTPKPNGFDAERTDVESKANLQVLHAPQTPVRSACTPETCQWPKQLYLRDTISASVTYASQWDLSKFPFDEQELVGMLVLVDNVAFPSDRSRIVLDMTSPLEEYGPVGETLAGLYPGTAWVPLSASLSQNPNNHLAIDFTIKMQRSAKGPIFKVLLPVLCNALFAILASRCAAGTRMKLLALSMIAATSMLQPSKVGLPDGVEGVPFVMALVISHMGIVAFMLLMTVLLLSIGHSAEHEGEEFRKAKRGGFFKMWTPAFDKKHELEQTMGIQPPVPPKELGAPSAKVAQIKPTSSTENVEFLGLSPKADETFKELEPKLAPDDTMTILTKAILVLPNLIHHAVQSTLPYPSNPEGFGKSSFKGDWMTEKERYLKKINRKVDDTLYVCVPPVYLLVWSILVIAYFAG